VTEWLPRLVARIPATVHAKLLVAFLAIAVLLIVLGAVGYRRGATGGEGTRVGS
jgi:hypothetical protein